MTSWVRIETIFPDESKIAEHGSEREGTAPHGRYIHEADWKRVCDESKERGKYLRDIRYLCHDAEIEYDGGDLEELYNSLQRIKKIADRYMIGG